MYITGYDSSSGKGSLDGGTFKYGGVQYTVSALETRVVHPMEVTGGEPIIHMTLSEAPPFSTMVLNIDGTEVVLSKSSSREVLFSSTTSFDLFNVGSTYTIRILSVS